MPRRKDEEGTDGLGIISGSTVELIGVAKRLSGIGTLVSIADGIA